MGRSGRLRRAQVCREGHLDLPLLQRGQAGRQGALRVSGVPGCVRLTTALAHQGGCVPTTNDGSPGRYDFREPITDSEIEAIAADSRARVLQTARPATLDTWRRLNDRLLSSRTDIEIRVYGFYGDTCDLGFLSLVPKFRHFSLYAGQLPATSGSPSSPLVAVYRPVGAQGLRFPQLSPLDSEKAPDWRHQVKAAHSLATRPLPGTRDPLSRGPAEEHRAFIGSQGCATSRRARSRPRGSTTSSRSASCGRSTSSSAASATSRRSPAWTGSTTSRYGRPGGYPTLVWSQTCRASSICSSNPLARAFVPSLRSLPTTSRRADNMRGCTTSHPSSSHRTWKSSR